MRHGSANRRQRGRNNNNNARRGNNNSAPNRSQVFDSNGPDVRIRGTAHQIVEKYEALAKDANASGDLSLCENYLQHVEHYQRMINTWDEQAQERAAAQKANENHNHNKPESDSDKAPEAAESNKQDKPKQVRKPRAKNKESEEDLGLPKSILTEAPV